MYDSGTSCYFWHVLPQLGVCIVSRRNLECSSLLVMCCMYFDTMINLDR